MYIPWGRKEEEPGEWQEEKNQFGGVRRYRMIGSIKEYETEVTTTHGTYTQAEIDAGRADQGDTMPAPWMI